MCTKSLFSYWCPNQGASRRLPPKTLTTWTTVKASKQTTSSWNVSRTTHPAALAWWGVVDTGSCAPLPGWTQPILTAFSLDVATFLLMRWRSHLVALHCGCCKRRIVASFVFSWKNTAALAGVPTFCLKCAPGFLCAEQCWRAWAMPPVLVVGKVVCLHSILHLNSHCCGRSVFCRGLSSARCNGPRCRKMALGAFVCTSSVTYHGAKNHSVKPC